MRAIRLRTAHMENPLGIDFKAPFLSWVCEGGNAQTAYEIRAESDGAPVWESGLVESSAMHAEYTGVLASRQQVSWKVRLYDEAGQPGEWSQPARFEMGLLKQQDWQADFIHPEEKDAFATGDDGMKPKRPASVLRRTFTASKAQSARLYITAHGIYVAYLNGQRVGEAVLTPGPGMYDKRLCYQTHDVTNLLREGENELRVVLGDGWFRSCTGVDGHHDLYGTELSLLCQLEADGKVICASDQSWQANQEGPIRDNDLQQGETYDARMETPASWHPVRLAPKAFHLLSASNALPVTENEHFIGKLIKTPNGQTVIDFGQNLAGYVEIEISAHAGDTLVLRHGETLDEHGNFTQENFQPGERHKEGGIRQQTTLICKEGRNFYKPSFTIMGFQYALVETDIPLEGAVFTAHAVYSKMETLARFDCANPHVNQLFHNSIWSMKSNFCDIPTDCPTRERAGWTGDVGIFVDTGLSLMDSLTVFRKWLGEVRLAQKEDGKVYIIAPPHGKPGMMTELLSQSAGWGDASIITPYALYLRTGDLSILRENYVLMRSWYAFLEGRARNKQGGAAPDASPHSAYIVEGGMDFGEWNEPDVDMRTAMMNPRKTVGTAYLAYSGKLMEQIARALGEEADVLHYREVSERARQAYIHTFTENGKIISDRQAEYARALQFGLLPKENEQEAADDLDKLVKQLDNHLNTGFLSTPFLCEVLARNGHLDTAYRLLLQDTPPSWLYAVKKGTNTIWETWEGIAHDGKVSASLNHYAYGVIAGWLVHGVCGIRVTLGKLSLRPLAHPLLGRAQASWQSPVGLVESGWHYEDGKAVYELTIPPNSNAVLYLPDGRELALKAGHHRIV